MTRWNDIDFRPAPPGWRAVFVDPAEADTQVEIVPIPGWLIQEDLHDARSRRVVAAAQFEGNPHLVDVDDGGDDPRDPGTFWKILPPGAAEPTTAEVVARRDYLRRIRQPKPPP
ncbi:hypothetical protein [Micromonospora aurantiaca (nom. illeg.)]|uniref:hypothetical protein n=1 Tax=Micromonospora aurantiaca (nom. illeg.) TaxID=47850 RepID=UPI003F4A03EB